MIPKIKHNADVVNIIPMVRQHQLLLPQMFFDKLTTILNSNNFQWYFQNATVDTNFKKESKNNFMFTHNLFMRDAGKTSDWFNTFEPILYSINEKIKVNELLRMKLNLYTNQHRKIKHASHCDFSDEKDKGIKTGILNFTTCNGGTTIENKIYNSKENELLIFNNGLKHFGITQTDTPIRIVLNIGWK